MSDIEQNSQWISLLMQRYREKFGDESVALEETHCAWVILAGDRAYKIKKPVDFGFLNFSTLALRKRVCFREVELNRRFAASLYLGVLPVCGTHQNPEIIEEGEPAKGDIIDYAVQMRRFSNDKLLSRQAENGQLDSAMLLRCADVLAAYHLQAERIPADTHFGTPAEIQRWMMENFSEIKKLASKEDLEAVTVLEDLARSESEALRATFQARLNQGFVKSCHGDLHLNNIVEEGGEPLFFDCIEFNDALRWIDTMSELAFLLMDLVSFGFKKQVMPVLNRYLEITGDFAGLRVLRFYIFYRSMVRAKVALLRFQQQASDHKLIEEFRHYIEIAESSMRQRQRFIVLMHGLSGSGKTTVARYLAEHLDAVHLRSDIERKRLFGMTARQRSGSDLNTGLYSSDVTQQVYARLLDISQGVIESDYPVIVDAAFLDHNEREAFLSFASDRSLPLVIVHCESSASVLFERVQERFANNKDASEANEAVVQYQLDTYQPLASDHQRYTVKGETRSVDNLCETLQKVKRALLL